MSMSGTPGGIEHQCSTGVLCEFKMTAEKMNSLIT